MHRSITFKWQWNHLHCNVDGAILLSCDMCMLIPGVLVSGSSNPSVDSINSNWTRTPNISSFCLEQWSYVPGRNGVGSDSNPLLLPRDNIINTTMRYNKSICLNCERDNNTSRSQAQSISSPVLAFLSSSLHFVFKLSVNKRNDIISFRRKIFSHHFENLQSDHVASICASHSMVLENTNSLLLNSLKIAPQ